MSSDIETTFDALLGQVELKVRELLKCFPKQGGQIYNTTKIFAQNLDQTVKDLIHEHSAHDNDRESEESLQTSRARVPSDAEFPSPLRSRHAGEMMLCQRPSSTTTSLAGEEQYLGDGISATVDNQALWSENDLLDYLPSFSELEIPSRSDQSALHGDVPIEPTSFSSSRDLPRTTTTGSCRASDDFVLGNRKSKKRAGHGQIEPRAKRSKKSAASNSELLPALRNLTQQDQIREVRILFENCLRQQERQSASLLTELFFAIANPASFRQLYDAIKATETMKSRESLRPIESSPLTVAEVVGRLDALDGLAAATSLWRRFYLLRLFRHRANQIKEVQAERTKRRLVSRKGGDSGKISSVVLDRMTRQAYSVRAGSASFVKKRKSLQNKLFAAAKWNKFCEEFPVGIIALVPGGGELQIQSQTVEYLRSRPFETLIKLLKDRRGKFVSQAAELLSPRIEALVEGRACNFALRLEVLEDPDVVIDEPLDSPVLLELCQHRLS